MEAPETPPKAPESAEERSLRYSRELYRLRVALKAAEERATRAEAAAAQLEGIAMAWHDEEHWDHWQECPHHRCQGARRYRAALVPPGPPTDENQKEKADET